MLLGLSTASFFGKYETEESAAYVSTLPLDCAEVFFETISEYTPEFGRLVRSNLNGMPCSSVHAQGVSFENVMMSLSPRARRDGFDIFRRVLDTGVALGAKAYVYHGKFTAQLSPVPWNLQMNADVLGPMCE